MLRRTVIIRGQTENQYYFDSIAGGFVTLAILLGTLTFTYVEQYPMLTSKVLGMIIMLISGIMLHLVFLGKINFKLFAFRDGSSNLLIYIAAGFLMLMTSQFFVVKMTPMTFLTPIFGTLFYTTAAVSEEIFFRYYLFTILVTRLKLLPGISEMIFATIVVSMLFMVYHTAVYGNEPSLLLLVFLSSSILCIIYYFSKHISVPILAHVLVNVGASL